MLSGKYGKYAIKRQKEQQQEGQKKHENEKKQRQRQVIWACQRVGLEICVFFFARRNAWIIFAFVEKQTQWQGGVKGEEEQDSAGLRAKDLRNTNKTLALLLLHISHLIWHPERTGRRMNTRDIFAKHLSHPSKMESKRFRRINTALQSVSLSLYNICLPLAHTHVLFKS